MPWEQDGMGLFIHVRFSTKRALGGRGHLYFDYVIHINPEGGFISSVVNKRFINVLTRNNPSAFEVEE